MFIVRSIVWLLLVVFVWPAQAQKLQLSSDEQSWLQQHGPVKVLVGPAIEPFYRTAASNGQPVGFAIDVLQLLAQRAGLQIEFVKTDSNRAGLQALREGSADMTAILRMNDERQSFLVQPGVLVPAESVFVTRKDNTTLNFNDFLSGRRIAVAAASVDDERLSREQPQATLVRLPTARQAFEAVAAGNADVMLTELHSAIWFIEANLLSNLQVRPIEGAARESWGPAVRANLPQLVSILTKAMDTLTPAERAELARRWLPRGSFVSFADQAANLSAAERDWVARRGDVRAGFDARFSPFTQAGALGAFEGLGADMLRAAMAKVGLRLVGQEGGSFAQAYERALRGDVNVVVGMARNDERRALFEFVGPFSTSPTVVVTRQDTGMRLVDDLADLGAARVGLLAQHFLIRELQSRAPALKLVEFETQEAALMALADGQLAAVVGNGHVISKLVQHSHTGQLRVAGVVRDADSELYFGIPKNQPELARVLTQGFAALTPPELSEIRQRWLMVQIDTGLRWKALLAWGLPLALAALVALAVLLLANRRLRVAHAQVDAARAAAVAAVAARGRFVAYLAHELRGVVSNVALGIRSFRKDSSDPQTRDRLLQSVENSTEQVGALLQATLDGELTLTQGVQLQAQNTLLVPWWAELMTPLRLRAESAGLVWQETPPAAPRTARLFDRTRLAQVLGNLLGNAIKFTPAGRIQVRALWDERRLQLRVEIEDDGPGLLAEDRLRLFEPYAQGQAGKRAASGAGLGLAISREIARAMGGDISAPLHAGGGALFVLELPLPDAPSDSAP